MRMRIVRLVMLDAGIIAASVWLVFLLRFDFQIPEMYVWMLPWAILIHIAVYAAFSFGFKVYNNIWRYTGMRELLQLLKVSVLTLVGVIVVNVSAHAVVPSYRLPISIYFAAGYVFLGIVGLRMVKRLLNDGFETTGTKEGLRR